MAASQDCISGRRIVGKGIVTWRSVHIVVKQPVLDETVHGLIKARDGLSDQTYRL